MTAIGIVPQPTNNNAHAVINDAPSGHTDDRGRPADSARRTMRTMRAIVQCSYGAPLDVLKLEDVPRPTAGELGATDVLVTIHASAINKGDWHLATGTPYLVRGMFGLRRPSCLIVGQEIAGVVEAVGSEVTAFAPGDRVFGEIMGRGWAEAAAVPQDKIAKIPDGVSFEHAAPAATAMTAIKALIHCAKVQRGQHVLINGAGGGVGTYAVQIARSLGATVTACCSASKADALRELGADHIIDYATEDFAASGPRFDVILDLVGNRPLRHYRKALTERGVYAACAGTGGRWLGPIPRLLRMMVYNVFVPQRLVGVLPPGRDELLALPDLLASGDLTSLISDRIALADVPAAVDKMGAGHMLGKQVVMMGTGTAP